MDAITDEPLPMKRKRSKRQHVNEESWDAKKQKLNREKGLKYHGKTKLNGRWMYNNEKNEREIKPRCKCTANKKSNKCSLFTEEVRIAIFKKFWTMSWSEKKVYVSLLCERNSTVRARNRKQEDVSRRACSFTYYLRREEERLRVCKTFFLNTLSIGEWSVHQWKKDLGSKELLHHRTADDNGVVNEDETELEIGGNKKSIARQKLFADRKASLNNSLSPWQKLSLTIAEHHQLKCIWNHYGSRRMNYSNFM
ncbi:hypothetical protein RI129_002897 [Pyrocoelia pectoralis]|uniref:Uncharacterized protein n=1 Tax=Pyrocoelia pectoralis TaxID=417401 RepID=A0AAN7ZI91_9COLE